MVQVFTFQLPIDSMDSENLQTLKSTLDIPMDIEYLEKFFTHYFQSTSSPQARTLFQSKVDAKMAELVTKPASSTDIAPATSTETVVSDVSLVSASSSSGTDLLALKEPVSCSPALTKVKKASILQKKACSLPKWSDTFSKKQIKRLSTFKPSRPAPKLIIHDGKLPKKHFYAHKAVNGLQTPLKMAVPSVQKIEASGKLHKSNLQPGLYHHFKKLLKFQPFYDQYQDDGLLAQNAEKSYVLPGKPFTAPRTKLREESSTTKVSIETNKSSQIKTLSSESSKALASIPAVPKEPVPSKAPKVSAWDMKVDYKQWILSSNGVKDEVKKATKTSKTSKATKASKNSKPSNASKAPKTSKASKSPKASKTPKSSNVSEPPKSPRSPETPKSPNAPKSSKSSTDSKASWASVLSQPPATKKQKTKSQSEKRFHPGKYLLKFKNYFHKSASPVEQPENGISHVSPIEEPSEHLPVITDEQVVVDPPNNLQVSTFSYYHHFNKLSKLLEYHQTYHQYAPQVSTAVKACHTPVTETLPVTLHGASISFNSPRTVKVPDQKELKLLERTKIKEAAPSLDETSSNSSSCLSETNIHSVASLSPDADSPKASKEKTTSIKAPVASSVLKDEVSPIASKSSHPMPSKAKLRRKRKTALKKCAKYDAPVVFRPFAVSER